MITQRPRAADAATPRRWARAEWSGVLLATAAATATGLAIIDHASKTIAIIPIGLAAAVGMGLLATVDFFTFVIAVLAIRAAMDWSKSAPTTITGAGASPGNAASALAILFMAAAFTWLLARHRQLAARGLTDAAPRSTLARPLLLFLACGVLSVPGSSRVLTSGLEALRIASAVTMLLVLERLLVNRRRVRMVIGAAIASAIVPGLVAASQLAGGGGLFTAGGFSRIRGTFVHPNPFAIYLTFLIIMGAAVLPHLGERVRVPALLVLGGCSLCLFLTYTRTGWIATVVGLVVVGALQNKRMLALMVMGGIVGLLLVPSIIGRFSDLGQTQRASGTAGNSLIWRLDYWTQILPLADKNPVTGIGLKMTQFNTEEQKAPHNDYIRSYVETGILGFLAYLGIQVAMVRTARRALRKTKGRQSIDRGVAVGFAGCATAFALISVVSNVISSSVLLWYLFAFAASAIAVSRFPAEEAVPAGVPA